MKAAEYIEKAKAGTEIPVILEELKGEMFKIIKDRRAQNPSSKFSVFGECQSKWQTIAAQVQAQPVAFELHIKETDPDFHQMIEASRVARDEQIRSMAQRRTR